MVFVVPDPVRASMTGKRLSIVVPTFDCEAYLHECLDSVLSQLPSDCELVVVDDGSRDATPAMLRALSGTRENLRVVLRGHGGVSAARNAGLDAARGDYVAFLDCDDCLRPDFLERALPLLEQGDDLYIFGLERVWMSGASEVRPIADAAFPCVSDFADEYVRTREMLVYPVCNKFYRRSVIEALSLRFEEGVSFGEDRLFNFRFLAGCGSVRTSGVLMYRYIQRSEESLSSGNIPHFDEVLARLNEAKIDCFLSLSKGTSEQERRRFVDACRSDERNARRRRLLHHK